MDYTAPLLWNYLRVLVLKRDPVFCPLPVRLRRVFVSVLAYAVVSPIEGYVVH